VRIKPAIVLLVLSVLCLSAGLAFFRGDKGISNFDFSLDGDADYSSNITDFGVYLGDDADYDYDYSSIFFCLPMLLVRIKSKSP